MDNHERHLGGLRALGRALDVKNLLATRMTWTGREVFGEVFYEPDWGPECAT